MECGNLASSTFYFSLYWSTLAYNTPLSLYNGKGHNTYRPATLHIISLSISHSFIRPLARLTPNLVDMYWAGVLKAYRIRAECFMRKLATHLCRHHHLYPRHNPWQHKKATSSIILTREVSHQYIPVQQTLERKRSGAMSRETQDRCVPRH